VSHPFHFNVASQVAGKSAGVAGWLMFSLVVHVIVAVMTEIDAGRQQ